MDGWKKITAYFISGALIATVIPTVSGCGSILKVSGIVYEWVNADNVGSIISMDEPLELSGMQLQPVPQITVVFNTQDYNQNVFRPSPVTDEKGNFSGSWAYTPHKNTLIHVTVNQDLVPPVKDQPIFVAVTEDFLINSSSHTFIIVLVPFVLGGLLD